MTSSQPATCRGSAAVASDKPRYIRSSYFIVANANRPEYAAIGPTDRDAQVRDHPQPDMRVVLHGRNPRQPVDTTGGCPPSKDGRGERPARYHRRKTESDCSRG